MKLFSAVKDFFHNAPISIRVIVIIFCAFTVLVIAISVVNIFNEQTPLSLELNPVNISNYNDVTSAPVVHRAFISQAIYDLVARAEGTSNIDLSDAKIREESYHETKEANRTTASYIIDIESLHYSFEIKTSWVDSKADIEDPDIRITCPHYYDVIYKDKKCIAASPEAQVSRYLPYNEYLSNGEKFHVEFRTYDSFQPYAGEQYLAVIVPRCMDQAAKDEAVGIFKNWLKSIYLDPNDYHIEAMGKCL